MLRVTAIDPSNGARVRRADRETSARADDHRALRLWLRLLTCTQLIERRVRSRLRERFATTLPRFDLMAQLERHPSGLKMGELSRRLMVTGGNVTGLTNQLVDDPGHVAAGHHQVVRKLFHLEAFRIALEPRHQVEARQRGAETQPQEVAHVALEQLRACE